VRRTKCLFAIIGIVVGLTTPVQMAFADGNGTPSVVPPQSESFPQTYGEWSAQWWQYVLGIPDNPTPNENPLTDPTGAQCPVGQWGPVFFLVGTAGPLPGTAIRNKCEVPAEVGLFFPIINISCAVPEDGIPLRRSANFAAASSTWLIQRACR
jgi:hypothetical protein